MDTIKILPHHAISLFKAFYLDRKPEELLSWYNDENMKQNGVETVNDIISNPNQLIQIVDSYDEICRMCPKNKQGNNYNAETACDLYDTLNPDNDAIKVLGLEEITGGKTATSKKLFELMKPTYDKLMNENHFDIGTKKLNLSQVFLRPKDKYMMNL